MFTTTNPTEGAFSNDLLRLKIDESAPSDGGDPPQPIEPHDIIKDLVMRRNVEGLNLIEQCCFALFERKEERFLLYVLAEVPDVCQYLYKTNDRGWFPLFRILDTFSATKYGFREKKKEAEDGGKQSRHASNERNGHQDIDQSSSACSDMIPNEISDIQTKTQARQNKKCEIAMSIIDRLISIGYDFLRPSCFDYEQLRNVSTLELLLTVPCDPDIFEKIIYHIYQRQRDQYFDIILQIKMKKGRFVTLMYILRENYRMRYLNRLVDIQNNIVELEDSDQDH